MLQEAIILAGGFGTRLRDVVSDLPKSMAPVNGKPFLDYQLKYLKHYGIKKVVLSVGYLAEKIMTHYGDNFEGLPITYSIEKDPLGTGGGIRLSMEKCSGPDVLVLNGDSTFDINLLSFYHSHTSFHADWSLSIRHEKNAARYGTIRLGDMWRIIGFTEKNGLEKPGLMNAGIYILNKEIFLKNTPTLKPFSIERDFFEAFVNELKIFGFTYEGYFIDIGIPTDYEKAQHDFKEFKYK